MRESVLCFSWSWLFRNTILPILVDVITTRLWQLRVINRKHQPHVPIYTLSLHWEICPRSYSLISRKLPFGIFWQLVLRDPRQHGGVCSWREASCNPHQWGVGVHGGAGLSRNLDTKCKDTDVILAPPEKTGSRPEPSQWSALRKQGEAGLAKVMNLGPNI